MTDFLRSTGSTKIRLGYLVAGLVIGALWLSHSEDPPLEIGLRLLALMAVVMVASTLVRRAAERRGKRVPQHRIGRFLAVKVALLAGAVVAGIVLEGSIAHADMWIGVATAVVVALAGPALHPWLTGHADANDEVEVDELARV